MLLKLLQIDRKWEFHKALALIIGGSGMTESSLSQVTTKTSKFQYNIMPKAVDHCSKISAGIIHPLHQVVPDVILLQLSS